MYNILIADDEEGILDAVEIRLKSKGYNVTKASSGKEALSKADEIQPDLIIMDIDMPPPNGYQACRQIKENIALKHIPVILLTSKNSDSDQFWGMESGADAYITKPYSSIDLIEKVKAFLD